MHVHIRKVWNERARDMPRCDTDLAWLRLAGEYERAVGEGDGRMQVSRPY